MAVSGGQQAGRSVLLTGAARFLVTLLTAPPAGTVLRLSVSGLGSGRPVLTLPAGLSVTGAARLSSIGATPAGAIVAARFIHAPALPVATPDRAGPRPAAAPGRPIQTPGAAVGKTAGVPVGNPRAGFDTVLAVRLFPGVAAAASGATSGAAMTHPVTTAHGLAGTIAAAGQKVVIDTAAGRFIIDHGVGLRPGTPVTVSPVWPQDPARPRDRPGAAARPATRPGSPPLPSLRGSGTRLVADLSFWLFALFGTPDPAPRPAGRRAPVSRRTLPPPTPPDPVQAEWRSLSLPLPGGARPVPLKLFVRDESPERPNRPPEKHFLIETELGRLGRTRLYGRLRGRTFGLDLWLDKPLPEANRRALQDLFLHTGAAAGFTGTLTFRDTLAVHDTPRPATRFA